MESETVVESAAESAAETESLVSLTADYSAEKVTGEAARSRVAVRAAKKTADWPLLICFC